MEYRELGRTGWKVSAISFGAWAIGGAWGGVEDKDSLAALHRALDRGVNFFDTADVYGDGRSERLLARLRKERREPFHVATKAGRRLERQEARGYSRENLTSFIERSLENLETDTIELLQLHCPPTEVYYMPEVFGILDDFVKAGKLRLSRKSRRRSKLSNFPASNQCKSFTTCFASAPQIYFSRKLAAAASASWLACRWLPEC